MKLIYQDAVELFYHIIEIENNNSHANNNSGHVHISHNNDHLQNILLRYGVMPLTSDNNGCYDSRPLRYALNPILNSKDFILEDAQKFLTLVCHTSVPRITYFINEWVEVLLNQEGLFVNTADFNAQETLKLLLNHELACSNQIIAKAEKDGEIPVEFILSLILNCNKWVMRDAIPLIFSWKSDLNCTEDQLITAAKSLNGEDKDDAKLVMQLIEHTDIQDPAKILHNLCTARNYRFGEEVANAIWQKWFNSMEQEEQTIISEFNESLSSLAHLLTHNLQEIEVLTTKFKMPPFVVTEGGHENFNFNGILMNLFMDWPYYTTKFLQHNNDAM